MTHKKIFRVLVLAAFAAMVMIAPLAAAQGCQKHGDQKKMMGHGCGMAQGCMMLKNITDLSAEQKAKLEKLHAEHMKMMDAAKADMEKQAGEMMGLMKDPVDLKKAEAKIDELARLHAAMQKKCLAHRLAVKALLTEEQKAKLGEMGCGMMMHGQGCMMGKKQMDEKSAGCCKMKGEMKMDDKSGAGCKMKKEMKMDHSQCQKAAEEKKEEKK
jgi:Spy/CpxP family protein refolding chaperone